MSSFLRVLASDLVTFTFGLVLPPVSPLTSLATVVDLVASSTWTALIATANFTLLAHFTELEHRDNSTDCLTVVFHFSNCLLTLS